MIWSAAFTLRASGRSIVIEKPSGERDDPHLVMRTPRSALPGISLAVERLQVVRRVRVIRRVVEDLAVESPVPVIVRDESERSARVEIHAPRFDADLLPVGRIRNEA